MQSLNPIQRLDCSLHSPRKLSKTYHKESSRASQKKPTEAMQKKTLKKKGPTKAAAKEQVKHKPICIKRRRTRRSG